MVYSDSEVTKIKSFFDACNEMIEGRFILSDIKISKILKAIAGSEVLYNAFAKVLNNFKFNEEFEKSKSPNKVNGGYFILPEEPEKIMALVFAILLEVDSQKLSLQAFVNDFFYNPEGYNISYSNFASNILVPFKESVSKILGVNFDGTSLENNESSLEKEHEEILHVVKAIEPDSKQKILFANLKMALNELLAVVHRSRIRDNEKEEVQIVINAIFEAIKIENLTIINALVIPLEYMLGKNKSVKFYYNDFKECLIQFFYK